MARRVTLSQFKSMVRQAESQRRQAIDRYNQAVRQHNQKVKRAVDDTNRAIDSYNREARAHNARLRADRARISDALARLSSHRTVSYTVYRTSSRSLHEAYARLESQAQYSPSDAVDNIFALSEQENANSLEVTNSLLEEQSQPDDGDTEGALSSTKITGQLQKLSQDLHHRWLGALYALSPRNPDAARHFCTSAREIFVQVLNLRAPDADVVADMPDCPLTEGGTPTRRAKVGFLLRRKGMSNEVLQDFIEKDVENILELFRVFNDGTHGPSGSFELPRLHKIKRRVEDGILFLTSVAA